MTANQPPTGNVAKPKTEKPFSWTNAPTAEGWDALAGSPEEHAEAARIAEAGALKQYETDKLIFDVFTNGRGPEFLQWLESVTIRQPSFVAGIQEVAPGNVTVLPAEQQGFFREGQNSMFRYFEAAMDRAQAGPPATSSATERAENV